MYVYVTYVDSSAAAHSLLLVLRLTAEANMASASSLSLLGFKQLSVHLVDCLKTPTDPRLAIKLEPEGEQQM